MRQKEIELAWLKPKQEVSVHEESKDGRLTRRTRRMKLWKAERASESSSFSRFISIIFICSFFTCKYIFSFTHISFKALDLLYFIPSLYGKNIELNITIVIFVGESKNLDYNYKYAYFMCSKNIFKGEKKAFKTLGACKFMIYLIQDISNA